MYNCTIEMSLIEVNNYCTIVLIEM